MSQGDDETDEDINDDLAAVVNRETVRYARLCWWQREEDVRALVWQCALEARKKYDASRTRAHGIKPLATLIIRRTLSRWRLATRTPVSSSDHGRHAHGQLSAIPVDIANGTLRLVANTGVKAAWRGAVTPRVTAVVTNEADVEALFTVIEARTERAARRAMTLGVVEALAQLERDPELRKLWEDRDDE